MAVAVAGVCSCNHENSNWETYLEFPEVFTEWLEQTPTTAAPLSFETYIIVRANSATVQPSYPGLKAREIGEFIRLNIK